MRNAYRLILGFGIIAFTLLSPQIVKTEQRSVKNHPITDNILRSKIAFAVVNEAIVRGLNLHTLSELDHWKLRGPVLLEQQTDIHFLLREQYGRIVNTVYFGAALDAGSPSQNAPISPENRPVLYQKASEIIRDFIAQRDISVIIGSYTPIGMGEMAAIRRLQGEVRYTYEIINSAAISVPLKNIAALIKLPFITEIWPDSKGHLALADSIPYIGADKVHQNSPNGLGVTGKGVTVAVVDNGMRSLTALPATRITATRNPLFITRPPAELHHGTKVAGIIGAALYNYNTITYTGVAPEVDFLDARLGFTALQSDYSDIIDALGWAKDNGADVINLSMNWDSWKYGWRGEDEMSQLIDTLVEEDGIVVVTSAGNQAKQRKTGRIQGKGVTHSYRFNSGNANEVMVVLLWDNKSNDLDFTIYRDGNPNPICSSHQGLVDPIFDSLPFFYRESVRCAVNPGQDYTVQVKTYNQSSLQEYEIWLDDDAETAAFGSPNSEKTVGVPGYSPKVITVGSDPMYPNNTITGYSSQGPSDTGLIKPEVVAPGDVLTTTSTSPFVDQAIGTSMAAPHVSGVAALILDAVGKNDNGEWNFSPAEVKSAIVRGAQNLTGQPPDNEYGAGLVSADKIIFGDVVQPHATQRFKIKPDLLGFGYKFQAGYLNAENKYPHTTSLGVDFAVAISWEDPNNDLDLHFEHQNGNQIAHTPEQGQNYEKISEISFNHSIGSNDFFYLDVHNPKGNAPIRFTGASTQPIWSIYDINCDGQVNRSDVVIIEEILEGNETFVAGGINAAADVNGDRDVTVEDKNLIEEAIGVVPILSKVGPTNTTTIAPPQGTSAQDYTTWDLPEGAMKRIGKGSIDEIAYSPDGTRLAVASNIGIWIYDAQTGKELNLFTGHGQEEGSFPPGGNGVSGVYSVLSVSFSPDGKTLASAGVDGSIRLWDVRTGDTLSTLEGHTSWVNSVAFSPDGKTLASGSSDSTIRLWDVRIGDTILILRERGGPRRFSSVAFSPDGKTLASGNAGYDKKIHLWDVRTGDLLHTLTGHLPRCSVSVSFSPDGQTLATANGRWGEDLDGTIRLWDVHTGNLLHTLTGHRWYERIGVSFSPDGQTLATASGDLRLWDVRTGDTIRTLTGHTEDVYSISFSPDGQTLASGSRQEIRLWNVRTGDTLRTLIGHTGGVSVYCVSFSPDGQTLASAGGDSWGEDLDGAIYLWDVRTGDLLRTLTGHTDDVVSVSFSPDGNTLASGSGTHDGTIRLWDVRTGALLHTLIGHTEDVVSISFSPDGQTLVSGDQNRTTRLWDVRTGDAIRTLTGHRWSVSSDWQTLASGGVDGTTRLWDVRTGDLLRTFTGTGGMDTVSIVSLSPDGQTLANAGGIHAGAGLYDERIHLWDVRTGDLLHTFIGSDPRHTLTGGINEVHSVSFSPDGQTLASGDGSARIRLWNVRTGDLLHTLTTGLRIGDVYSVSFSPDGQTLTSIGDHIHLWDVRTGDLLYTFTRDRRDRRVFTRGGVFWLDWQTLATGSWEGTVLLWGLIPEPPRLAGDVNDDGEVNIQDLVAVAAALGETGENAADVNGDGQVNIQDLVAVAAALGEVAAAPAALRQQGAAHLTQEEVQHWLTQARQLNLTDARTQRGILFLEQLLSAMTPKETALLPNYPNPFNPETWIPYQLATPADVTLKIYDIQGRVVRTLDLGHQRPGMYQSKSRAAYWDGRNAVGEPVASGVYFYTLTAGDFSATRKLLIRK